MQEIAICPICAKQVTAPAGKIPMACPDCHSNIKRAARLYVNEDGVLVRYDGHLSELYLPEAVRTVGENVFFCHTELEIVHFPHGLLAIESSAFGKCGLREVILPDSLLSLGQSAFAGCSQLVALSLPAKLREIPARALEGCSALTAVTVSWAVSCASTAPSSSSTASVSTSVTGLFSTSLSILFVILLFLVIGVTPYPAPAGLRAADPWRSKYSAHGRTAYAWGR